MHVEEESVLPCTTEHASYAPRVLESQELMLRDYNRSSMSTQVGINVLSVPHNTQRTSFLMGAVAGIAGSAMGGGGGNCARCPSPCQPIHPPLPPRKIQPTIKPYLPYFPADTSEKNVSAEASEDSAGPQGGPKARACLCNFSYADDDDDKHEEGSKHEEGGKQGKEEEGEDIGSCLCNFPFDLSILKEGKGVKVGKDKDMMGVVNSQKKQTYGNLMKLLNSNKKLSTTSTFVLVGSLPKFIVKDYQIRKERSDFL